MPENPTARRRMLVSTLAGLLLPAIGAPAGGEGADSATARQRLRDAIADMQRPHEVVPLGVAPGVGWKNRPQVAMGTEPYARTVPSYWRGMRFAEWRAMLPWFVIYEGEPSNPARNAQVEIGGIECWVFTESGQRWVQVGAAARPAWDSLYAPNAVDRVAPAASGRAVSGAVRYGTGPTHMVHGGLGQLDTPWIDGHADMLAILAVVRHRLVLADPNGSDDRDRAIIGVQAGVDYYPWKGAKLADMAASYVPGAGLGRFVKVVPSWRYSTFFVAKDGVSTEDLLSREPPAFSF